MDIFINDLSVNKVLVYKLEDTKVLCSAELNTERRES